MALTAGRSQVCTDAASGGVVRMALANRSDIASVTVVSGEITAITMDATKVFYLFTFLRETLSFTEAASLENNSALYEGTIAGTWTGWSTTDRTRLIELANASRCGMVAAIELEEGDTVICGINIDKPTEESKYTVVLNSAEFTSGVAFSDAAQRTIELGYRSSAPAARLTTGWTGVPLT